MKDKIEFVCSKKIDIHSLYDFYNLQETNQATYDRGVPCVSSRAFFDSVRKAKLLDEDGVEMYECQVNINRNGKIEVNAGNPTIKVMKIPTGAGGFYAFSINMSKNFQN